jgi:endonuclease-3
MTRQEKAHRIAVILDELFPTVDIPLEHRDPFTLLVAVVLSAQTTDKLVNEVTPALFARAATPEQMAALPVEEIRNFIRRIGLTDAKAKGNLAGRAVLVGCAVHTRNVDGAHSAPYKRGLSRQAPLSRSVGMRWERGRG